MDLYKSEIRTLQVRHIQKKIQRKYSLLFFFSSKEFVRVLRSDNPLVSHVLDSVENDEILRFEK